MQEQTGQAAMRSLGRPEINQRITKQAFWEQIVTGLQGDDAAWVCEVSQPLGPRWFREAGGIAPTNLGATSGRYLGSVDVAKSRILSFCAVMNKSKLSDSERVYLIGRLKRTPGIRVGCEAICRRFACSAVDVALRCPVTTPAR